MNTEAPPNGGRQVDEEDLRWVLEQADAGTLDEDASRVEGILFDIHRAALGHLERERVTDSLRALARDAFAVRRCAPLPESAADWPSEVLLTLALGLVAGADVSSWLRAVDPGQSLKPEPADWATYVLAQLSLAWAAMAKSPPALEEAVARTANLYAVQPDFERAFLEQSRATGQGRAVALRLVALYHLAQVTHDIAVGRATGEPPHDGKLKTHLAQAVGVADPGLYLMLLWLRAALPTQLKIP